MEFYVGPVIAEVWLDVSTAQLGDDVSPEGHGLYVDIIVLIVSIEECCVCMFVSHMSIRNNLHMYLS